MTSLVAAIQMCSSNHVDENLAVASQFIAEAAAQQAKLIVLPENFAIMDSNDRDKIQAREPIGEGKIQTFLAEQAKQHGVWLVGGTIPLQSNDPNKVMAASLVFNDRGDLAARYDKMHLFDVDLPNKESYRESAITEPGHNIVVIDTPIGKLGMAVCYDVRFPELFRCLFNRGAEIIALPSAFTVKTGQAHWEVLVRSRAIENFVYMIGAAQGGIHTHGRQTFGNSLMVDPWGTVIAKQTGTTPGVIYGEIDLNKLHEIRQSIPVAEHQMIFSLTGPSLRGA